MSCSPPRSLQCREFCESSPKNLAKSPPIRGFLCYKDDEGGSVGSRLVRRLLTRQCGDSGTVRATDWCSRSAVEGLRVFIYCLAAAAVVAGLHHVGY